MTRPRTGPKILERFIAVCLITLALAIVMPRAFQRLDTESLPRTIELVFPESGLLAETAKDPDAPKQLLQAGVTTLVRTPYTLDDMLRYGLAEAWHPEPDLIEIRIADTKLTSSATVYLTGQFGMDALQIRLRETAFVCDVKLPEPIEKIVPNRIILEIPAGPMPEGFRKALLLPAGDWGKTKDLNQLTQAIYSLKPDSVIPYWQGGMNTAYFFRSYFNTPWLRKPVVVIPEFSLPAAAKAVVRRQKKHVFYNAHWIEGHVAAKYTSEQLCRRVVRAVKERGISFIYVEPPKRWTWDQTLAFYSACKKELKANGFNLGAARNTSAMQVGHMTMLVIYIGLAGIAFLFFWQAGLWAVGFTGKDEEVDHVLTIRLKPMYFRLAAVLSCLALLIIHWEGSMAWGGKIAAWLIAVLVPLLALSHFVEQTPRVEASWSEGLLKSAKEFLTLTVWSFFAGLTISVLLYQPAFVQRWDLFLGVKAAYLVPLLLAGIYLFPSVLEGSWWRIRFSPGRRWWFMGLLLVMGLGLGLLVVRSGNATWLPTAVWETNVRDWLETLLGVRPRWKEFLIGHPLLLAGLYGRRLPGSPERIWPDVCIWIGFIGQLSLINTFCHIHTPLAVSLLRTWQGLWIGLLLGVLATVVLRALWNKRSQA